jgi:hypothetical protein
MKLEELKKSTARRGFLGTLVKGATAFGLLSLASPLKLNATTQIETEDLGDSDLWFNQIKGKHKIVFDCTQPHEVFPFAWPKVFLITNSKTGTPEKENSVVVVLRHDAIPYAFEDRLWSSYGFGEVFKADDPKTKKPSMRNPFWKPMPGDFQVPGVGNVQIGINELQESGVMFCVCDMAITVFSNVVAGIVKKDPVEVKKDWMTGLLPGIQVVPSGVWAVGRAQEHGCAYCFAG